MKIKITMSTRDKSAYAEGEYNNGQVIVKAGGKVSPVFKGGPYAESFRNNKEYVDEKGTIIKDCSFSSPSTAAQFVNGNISNGLRVWKVGKVTLGDYLSRK